MDNRLEEEIKYVEKDLLAIRRPFTALDVGNELKRRGVNARQREVSPVVRDHFSNSDIYTEADYTRTSIPVNDSKKTAFLYLNIADSPESYIARDQSPLEFDPAKPMFLDDIDKTCQTPTSATLDDYVGSSKSDIYHSKDCHYAIRIKPENKVSFDNMNTAISMDYHKCRRE